MKHLPVAIAVVIAALTFINPPQPTAGGPVATAMASASKADKATLRRIYTALAQKTKQDNGQLITTVGMWRTLHANTLKLAASEMRGKYPGLDVAVEKVMAEHFPLDDVAMSGATAEKVAAACTEVAKQSE